LSNDLCGVYDPVFYANKAVEALHKSLGLAGRVYRGYEEEWKQHGVGDTISVGVPSTFSATDVNTSTGGTTQDIETDEVQISLDTWKEVKFKVTEKKLSLGPDRIISDHINPAGYAIAKAIDDSLVGLIKKVPNYADFTATPAWSDLTDARAVLRDLGVPLEDGNAHFMLDSTIESAVLGMSQFSNGSYAGANAETLLSGHVGKRLGIEFFTNQNAPTHTSGASADTAGSTTVSAGDTSLTIDDLTDTQTVKEGDIFTIAGDTQKYVFTEDGEVGAETANKLVSIGCYPAIKEDSEEGAVVTLENSSSKNYSHNFLFHRNAIALAMAPLTEEGSKLGAKIASVKDPVTGLTLRSRMFYDGDHNIIKVSIDALWGVKLLDCNRGVRVRRAYT